MTNYEKIKSMSIDKMAEFLLDFDLCEVCPYSDEDGNCTNSSNGYCIDALKEWLKAESEED